MVTVSRGFFMGAVFKSQNFVYDKLDGLYRLKCGETVLADMDRVAIAFAVQADGTTLLHKHGTQDSVMEWYKWAKSRYEQYGLRWIADELCMLVSESWDVNELNRIVSDGAYLTVFLKKANINLRGHEPISDPSSTRSSAGEISTVSIHHVVGPVYHHG